MFKIDFFISILYPPSQALSYIYNMINTACINRSLKFKICQMTKSRYPSSFDPQYHIDLYVFMRMKYIYILDNTDTVKLLANALHRINMYNEFTLSILKTRRYMLGHNMRLYQNDKILSSRLQRMINMIDVKLSFISSSIHIDSIDCLELSSVEETCLNEAQMVKTRWIALLREIR
jgi:hypothetical protein